MPFGFRTLDDVTISGKSVFLRSDLNVPIDRSGVILDSTRIKATIPTIAALLKGGIARIFIASHLDPWEDTPASTRDPRLKLDRVAQMIQKLLLPSSIQVQKVDDCLHYSLDPFAKVVVLENLRFYKEEQANDPVFAERLVQGCDLIVFDAFGAAHRSHASTDAIMKFKPAIAGKLMEREVAVLSSMMTDPKRPFVAVMGGKKVTTKLPIIERLLKKVDTLLIGGGIAYTFRAAQGLKIGQSFVEPALIPTAERLLQKFSNKIILSDYVVCDDGNCYEFSKGLPENVAGMEVGVPSVLEWVDYINTAKTIFWNGPLGYYEGGFVEGTYCLVELIKKSAAIRIIGGGDIVSVVARFNLQDSGVFISTGGGAALEFIERFGNSQPLPAIRALEENKKCFNF